MKKKIRGSFDIQLVKGLEKSYPVSEYSTKPYIQPFREYTCFISSDYGVTVAWELVSIGSIQVTPSRIRAGSTSGEWNAYFKMGQKRSVPAKNAL